MTSTLKTLKKIHDSAVAVRPSGAPACDDTCSFCTHLETAQGGEPAVETISQETHEALLKQAVVDAKEEAAAEIKDLQEQLASTKAERDELAGTAEENASAIERLEGELDAANLELKTAKDKVSEITEEMARKEEEARRDELASKRAEQVREMELFEESYIEEKASSWASLSDEDWAERISEWQSMRPASEVSDDTASAMSGGAGKPTNNVSARRSVLGLS